MADFTGLGQGFNQGLQTGAGIGAGIQNRGLEKAIAEAQLKEKRTDQDIKAAQENIVRIGEMAKQAISSGQVSREQAAKAFGPMLEAAKSNALRFGELRGRDTTPLINMADSISSVFRTTATPTEAATTAAQAGAAGQIAGATALAPVIGGDAAALTIPGVKDAQELALDRNAQALTRRGQDLQRASENYLMPNGVVETVDNHDPAAFAKRQDIIKRGGNVLSSFGVEGTQTSDLGVSNSEIKDFTQAEVAAMNVVDVSARMKEQLAGKDVLTGLASGFVRGLSSIAGNVQQLAQLSRGTAQIGSEVVDEAQLSNPANYNFTGFGDAAALSAAFKTNVVTLAYMRARSFDPGGRLSDRDIQQVIGSIAAESGDKGQIAAALDETVRNTLMGYNNLRISTEGRGVKLPPVPAKLQIGGGDDKGKKIGAGAGGAVKIPTTQEEFDALSDEEKVQLKKTMKKSGVLGNARR